MAQSPLKKTRVEILTVDGIALDCYINEYWTARQRQSSSIQEISYRACFKPQLPRFFIRLLTKPGDIVYDPFAGRGTTPIEAAIMGREVAANDINPLSKILTEPRLAPPTPEEVDIRLASLTSDPSLKNEIDLSMFYHPQTEMELLTLRRYLQEERNTGREDRVDRWIRMVATNRLTGHSKGFFSVYTLPPNQAVSPESQVKINRRLNQFPEYRDVKQLIVKKTRQLLRRITNSERNNLLRASEKALFLENDAAATGAITSDSISLTVTSPPFLDIVRYARDNWLRCWFNCLNISDIENKITVTRTLEEWERKMAAVFRELYRITRPGGWVAFEVGEVRKGRIELEKSVLPLGLQCGFEAAGILINDQRFTKTSNIWGVANNRSGTNSNRIVLFRKPPAS
ncbi:MAG TPA: site-specific DNA-methyltransferase [Firmicutes bacterium]|nr:site-specific DNA-methyltransferase [Bacillota bacterium]